MVPERLPDALDGCLILEPRAVLAKRALPGPPVGRLRLPDGKDIGLFVGRREKLGPLLEMSAESALD